MAKIYQVASSGHPLDRSFQANPKGGIELSTRSVLFIETDEGVTIRVEMRKNGIFVGQGNGVHVRLSHSLGGGIEGIEFFGETQPKA